MVNSMIFIEVCDCPDCKNSETPCNNDCSWERACEGCTMKMLAEIPEIIQELDFD